MDDTASEMRCYSCRRQECQHDVLKAVSGLCFSIERRTFKNVDASAHVSIDDCTEEEPEVTNTMAIESKEFMKLLTGAQSKPLPLNRVVIIGLGLIGGSIAMCCAKTG